MSRLRLLVTTGALTAALVAALAVLSIGRAARSQPAVADQIDPACGTTNPYFVTTCFAGGGVTDVPALVAFHDTISDTDHLMLATSGQIGAAYGIAYQPAERAIYVAAYHKRGSPFGPGGPGAIYRVEPATGNVALWATVPNAGADTHDPAGNYYPDAAARPGVGITSLGDIDLTEDGSVLVVMNLNERRIYRYRLADKALLGTIDHGAAAEPWATDARPFGLKIWHGKLYHGLVNSAFSTQAPADLQAYVYESDLDGANMRLVNRFGLVFDRGLVDEVAAVPATWQPWKDSLCIIPNPGGVVNWNICPQPMLSDIEFADNGDMLLGFRDRNGDMTYFANSPDQVPPGEGNGIAAGDILLSRYNGSTWDTQPTPETFAQDAGPGLGATNSVHDETGFGGLARVFLADVVAMTAETPLRVLTGGGIWFHNGTAQNTAREELYYLDVGRNFGKANGLGDLETLCPLPPVQPGPSPTPSPALCLGDLVWADLDNDGLYEPGSGEQGIAGVTVVLHEDTNGDGQCTPGVDRELARTTTGVGGGYIFCDLAPGDYVVTIPASNFAPGGPLAGMGSSTGNDPAPDPDDDVNNDDNGTPVGGEVCSRAVTLALGTEPRGDGDDDPNTNRTVDFGFVSQPTPGASDTPTPVPPTVTPGPTTVTPGPPTVTPSTPTPTAPPPTNTPVVPSVTPPPPTNTPVMPTATSGTPQPTAPATATATGGCTPRVCPQLVDGIPPDVPRSEIDPVLANPSLIAGFATPMVPGKPVGPYNPQRCWLSVRSPAQPYAVPYNQLIWRASCP